MKETALWGHLRPRLNRFGKFQKISDRFTSGIPDVLGMASSVGYALELKELKGVIAIKTKFRPGQLDWLDKWDRSGGVSLIVATYLRDGWIFPHTAGRALEGGIQCLGELGVRFTGNFKWEDMVEYIFAIRGTDAPVGRIVKKSLTTEPVMEAYNMELKSVGLDPTPEMVEAGAQRLVSWEDGCTWPDSWGSLQVVAARQEAERVWRSMWLAAVTANATELTGRGSEAPEGPR